MSVIRFPARAARGAVAGLVVGSAALVACVGEPASESAPPQASTQARVTQLSQRPDGVMVVETRRITALVVAVDRTTRKVTLRGPRGGERVIEAGPDVVNLDEIDVGDEVEATVMQSVAVRVGPGGTAPAVRGGSGAAVVPRGDGDRAVILADTVDVTARVVAVDPGSRKLVLEGPEGRQRLVQVAPGTDLRGIEPGQSLQFEVTEVIAIGLVELP